MAKRVELDLVIDERGRVHCDVHDQGPGCLEIETLVQEVLGPVELERRKAGFFERQARVSAKVSVSARRRSDRGG